MKLVRRGLTVVGMALGMVGMFALSAFAEADADVVDALTDATANVKDTLIALIAIGLAIGVVLYLFRKGWKTFRGFAK